jgi:hypothetical protein
MRRAGRKQQSGAPPGALRDKIENSSLSLDCYQTETVEIAR